MRGRTGVEDGGQLALLDAIVFFAIAVLVSSAVLSMAVEPSRQGTYGAGGRSVDAANTLEVLLRVSIGVSMSIQIGDGVILSGKESVADCLRAEAHALVSGEEPDAFDRLNGVIQSALDALSGTAFRAHLEVLCPGSGSGSPLFAIPDSGGDHAYAYSSSADLPFLIGMSLTVVLVLEPSTPSELVQV